MNRQPYKGFYIAVYKPNSKFGPTHFDLKKRLKQVRKELVEYGISGNANEPMKIKETNPNNPKQHVDFYLYGVFFKKEDDLNLFLLLNSDFIKWSLEDLWKSKFN